MGKMIESFVCEFDGINSYLESFGLDADNVITIIHLESYDSVYDIGKKQRVIVYCRA